MEKHYSLSLSLGGFALQELTLSKGSYLLLALSRLNEVSVSSCISRIHVGSPREGEEKPGRTCVTIEEQMPVEVAANLSRNFSSVCLAIFAPIIIQPTRL